MDVSDGKEKFDMNKKSTEREGRRRGGRSKLDEVGEEKGKGSVTVLTLTQIHEQRLNIWLP